LRVSLPRTFLEGKKEAYVGAVLRLGRKKPEYGVQDVPDRPRGVTLDVGQQLFGLAVLLAVLIDRGVEVLLGCGVLDRRCPAYKRPTVDRRDLLAIVGEALQVETRQAVMAGADTRVGISGQWPQRIGQGHQPMIVGTAGVNDRRTLALAEMT
jgi:hypothetical protein